METKTLGKTAAAVALLALPSASKAQDATAVKFFGSPKAIVRIYDNARTPAVGLGVEGGIVWKDIAAGGSLTVAQTKEKPVFEESSIWASTTFGGVKFAGYVYTDEFYIVPFSEPAVGINATYGKVKLGAESGKGFTLQYAKAQLGDVTPGVTVLEWDGKVQALAPNISTTGHVGSVTVSTQTQYTYLFESGNGSIQFRVTISP